MLFRAFEEALHGFATAIVVQHPFRRFRGPLRQTLPLGKRAGFLGECGPAGEIKRNAVSGLDLIHDRAAHVEQLRPGYVVAVEFFEPFDVGGDFCRFST